MFIFYSVCFCAINTQEETSSLRHPGAFTPGVDSRASSSSLLSHVSFPCTAEVYVLPSGRWIEIVPSGLQHVTATANLLGPSFCRVVDEVLELRERPTVRESLRPVLPKAGAEQSCSWATTGPKLLRAVA